GPPGTGKTSLGRSIAEALGRKFARISLGGIRDEAEIRGHRRTYIGAMPGRIIQTMKRVGTVNPLIMLDEIDKVGADYRGDPTAALLEVLDPEQNNAFSDHYLDLPYDLSQVLFITTANVMGTIPPALLDRMEIIEFSGYIDQEKLAIAKKFLIPRHLEEHALVSEKITLTDKAIQGIMHNYTYESGVRTLDREIGRVCRKVVRRLDQGKKVSQRITDRALLQFLGPPKRKNPFLARDNEVGVVAGLSWTPAGGDLLLIEVSLQAGKGNLVLTGQLGDVMKESAQAALSYTKANASEWEIDIDQLEKIDIHVHVPEGAIPKDGPSAGITITTALVSALTNRPVRHDVAMTGEMTLRGRVLAIGGLKIKIIAAHRSGIKTIIIPEANLPDLEEIPRSVRQTLDIVAVKQIDQVLKTALT
ncbi:MAG: endopeptidase La, partial [Chloroflexota bacterium]